MMATDAQILANRQNAQKSTGPRTPDGKAVASQNSLKHGLLTRQDVISTESQVDFDLYRNQLIDELAPATPMESILAERIVSLSWRLKRIICIQNQTIDALNTPSPLDPIKKLSQSLLYKGLNLSQPAPQESPTELVLGRLAVKDFSDARVLDRLLMYERRIENSLYKTILELQRLTLIKKLHPNSNMNNEL
jgi:hypothetical protein